MSYTFAVSDIHGELSVFDMARTAIDLSDPESRLILLGDYVPHQRAGEGDDAFLSRCVEALGAVRDVEAGCPGQVVVLMGNWELWLLNRAEDGELSIDYDFERWLRRLPYLHETETQVFVHAGIDEEAGEYWRWGADNGSLCEKYPPTFGTFEKDIVAGHVGTAQISGDADFHGVFWDGASHYFIDGTTEVSGQLPVLRYDCGTGSYDYLIASELGIGAWLPVQPMEPWGFGGTNDDEWWY